MNWISANWEKALLLLVSLIVILIGVLFVKQSLNFKDRFDFADVVKSSELPETGIERVRSAKAVVSVVDPWKTPVRGGSAAKEVPLFVSVPIVQVGENIIDMMDPNAPMIREPVSNLWLQEHGLNYKESDILTQDEDGDSFTNIEEWDEKTSPSDPASHPSYGLKLVMVARQQQNYVIEFAGTPDANSYQLTRHPTTNYQRDTFIQQLGTITEDGKIKLERFEELEGTRNGITIDVSKLHVTYVESGQPFELVRRQKVTIPTYFLEVTYKLGELERQYYKIGEEIVLPNDPETKYKVVDIQENSATISFLDANGSEKKIEIKK
jgi:hypothetical protein